MLLLCCEQFFASLDESLQLEMLLCSWKRFYVSFVGSVRLEMLLCSWKRFYASLDKSVLQGILFSDELWAGIPFWIFPPKLEQERAEPFCVVTSDDSSHSQGQSRKRLLLASRGHPVRSLAYQGSCIDPSHQSHTLDPIPDLSFPITHISIQLLIKD